MNPSKNVEHLKNEFARLRSAEQRNACRKYSVEAYGQSSRLIACIHSVLIKDHCHSMWIGILQAVEKAIQLAI